VEKTSEVLTHAGWKRFLRDEFIHCSENFVPIKFSLIMHLSECAVKGDRGSHSAIDIAFGVLTKGFRIDGTFFGE
jgi:hypothetical protein